MTSPPDPKTRRRLSFRATVYGVRDKEGISLTDAFHAVNDHHQTLRGTFDTYHAFVVWCSRHRDHVRPEDGVTSEIPTDFEDGGGIVKGVTFADVYDRPDLTIETRPDLARRRAEEARDFREYVDRMLPGMMQQGRTNPAFYEQAIRFYVEHKLAGRKYNGD